MEYNIMNRRLLRRIIWGLGLGVALSLCSLAAYATTVSGTFKFNGTPFTGSMVYQLVYPATTGAYYNLPISSAPITIQNGQFASLSIDGNDTMLPGRTYYAFTFYDQYGNGVTRLNYYISGSTFDLGAAVPTPVLTNNMSFLDLLGLRSLSVTNATITNLTLGSGGNNVLYGKMFDTGGAVYNVMGEGAFCDSNGTTGNGHNDRTAIQALLSTVSLTGTGATIYIPAGHICRIASTDSTINTDFLSISSSNLEMTGGGTLFFDPVLVSGHPTFGTAISGIYAAGLQIYSPGCSFSTVSNPQDITTGRSTSGLISHIDLHDFALTSVGSYNSLIWNGSAEPSTNIPLNNVGVAIWCADDVNIHHLSVHNFYSDAVEPWGVVGLTLTDNNISEIGFNGVGSGWTSDSVLSDNVMLGVGQGMEVEGLRSTITGNVIGPFAMNGIMSAGGPSAGTNISTIINGNTLTRDATVADGHYGINVACNGASSTCVDSANVGPNILSGNFGAGVYVQPGTVASVHNNTISMTATTGSPVGAVQAEEGTAWGVLNPVTILDNTLVFSSSVYQAAVFATGTAATGIQSIVKNNAIISSGFTGSSPYGVYLFSTGIECQSGNASTVGTPANSFCNDGSTAPTVIAGQVVLASGVATVSTSAACNTGGTCNYSLTNCGSGASTAIGTPTLNTTTPGVSFSIQSLRSTAAVETGDDSRICWQIYNF